MLSIFVDITERILVKSQSYRALINTNYDNNYFAADNIYDAVIEPINRDSYRSGESTLDIVNEQNMILKLIKKSMKLITNSVFNQQGDRNQKKRFLK